MVILLLNSEMGVYSMPDDRINTEIVEIYKQRDQRRLQVFQQGKQNLVQISLKLPDKHQLPAGANGLFAWGLRQILELLPQLESCAHGHDRLGPWALLGTAIDARTLKRQAVALENASPAGVLLDIDIYNQQGEKLARKSLDLPQRRCLICQQAALDCLQKNNHTSAELKLRVNKLLAPFKI